MSNSASRPPGSGREWEELLQQLRQQPRAQPQPFFYARVQARLIAQTQPRGWVLPSWARRPAYAALLGTLLLLVSGDGVALRSPAAPSSYHGQPAPLLPR
jgi:hypothetical protein